MKSESSFKTIESTTYIENTSTSPANENYQLVHQFNIHLSTAIMIYAPNVAKLFNEF